MGCQIGALPRTPFASSRRFTHREACHWIRGSLLSPMNPVPLPPQGETRSMERKNRESYISCTIPQFPPFGGERSEPITRMFFMPYDTESQSRNVLASPLGEEGHEVAKGWTRVRSKNDTGRRLAVRIAMGCQIGALPRTPFASSRRSPQGETRSMERKNSESYTSRTISVFSPLWCLTAPPFPRKRWDYGCLAMWTCLCRKA